jgi:uncharacterized protein (DUF2384 family)
MSSTIAAKSTPARKAKAGKTKLAVASKAAPAVAKAVLQQKATPLKYGKVFLASRAERFNLIDKGVPAQTLLSTIRDLGLTQDRTFKILGFPRSSILKKITARRVLERDESTLVVGLRRLIGQVEIMVAESGDPEGFNAAKWIAGWMETPNPALAGKCPADYMHLPEGQEMLSQLLAQMQSGAYA